MSEAIRVSARDVKPRMQSAGALLVCVYQTEEKFLKYQLEGAISYQEFSQKIGDLSKNQEMYFYCA